MSKYNRKIAAVLAIITLSGAVSGCDFIVKEAPIDYNNTYSTVNKETPEDAESNVDSESSEESDTSHKEEKDTSSKAESTDSKKNTSSSSTSSKSTSSKTTSSKSTSSKSTSSASNSVTGIKLDIYSVTLEIGQSKMPMVTMTPATAANKGEVWTSSDEKVATVNKNGVIYAVSSGKCVITVTSADNSKVNAKVNVTVNAKPNVTAISVDTTEKTIQVGESFMPIVTMTPLNADTLEERWTSSDESIATVNGYGVVTGIKEGSCKITVESVSNSKVKKEISVTVKGKTEVTPSNPDNDDVEYGDYGEAYIDGVLIVNKTYGLPSSYNPRNLTGECSKNFSLLKSAAAEDGISIYITSGFRSYEEQESLYNGYVNYYGQEMADTLSAKPGHSEHQTGLAIDCNDASDYFVGTPAAEWLAEHCYEYGFIIRYPEGKQSVTGYKYEPWHIRFVGYDLAEKLHNSGLTLEEYFDITSEY